MAQPIDDATDRRMRLRYTGRCRLCGAMLAVGTDAIYERDRRTVRCLECARVVAPPADISAVASPAAQQPEDVDILRLRAPASSEVARGR